MASDSALAGRAPSSGAIGVVVGAVTIWLDSTTIRDATRALGSHERELKWVAEGAGVLGCFETATDDRAFVTLEAHGGDTEPVVTMEIGRARPPESLFPECIPLGTAARSIRTTSGLLLGMSRVEAERLLDESETVEKGVANHPMPGRDGRRARSSVTDSASAGRDGFVTVTYRNDVVVSIYVAGDSQIVAEPSR